MPFLAMLMPWLGIGAVGGLAYYVYAKGKVNTDAIQAKAKMNTAYGHVRTLATRVTEKLAGSGGVPADLFARASALKDEVDAVNALDLGLKVTTAESVAARADAATKEAYIVAGKLATLLGEQNPVEAPPDSTLTTLLVLGGLGVASYYGYKWLTSKHGDTIPQSQLPRYAGGRRKK